MGAALRSIAAFDSDFYDEMRRQVIDAIMALLEAGKAAGTIRDDVGAESVVHATGAIWLIPDAPGWEDQARKVLALIMDGLRPHA
jgi:Transcriptional regulator SbtR-like, C-terminal domain